MECLFIGSPHFFSLSRYLTRTDTHTITHTHTYTHSGTCTHTHTDTHTHTHFHTHTCPLPPRSFPPSLPLTPASQRRPGATGGRVRRRGGERKGVGRGGTQNRSGLRSTPCSDSTPPDVGSS